MDSNFHIVSFLSNGVQSNLKNKKGRENLKRMTVEEYEKLPWNHVMCNLTPLVMGMDIMSSWCNDHKIIVSPEPGKPTHMIPNDKENFARGYVKRPPVAKKMTVLIRCDHCRRYMEFDLAELKTNPTPTCNTCSGILINVNGWIV